MDQSQDGARLQGWWWTRFSRLVDSRNVQCVKGLEHTDLQLDVGIVHNQLLLSSKRFDRVAGDICMDRYLIDSNGFN